MNLQRDPGNVPKGVSSIYMRVWVVFPINSIKGAAILVKIQQEIINLYFPDFVSIKESRAYYIKYGMKHRTGNTLSSDTKRHLPYDTSRTRILSKMYYSEISIKFQQSDFVRT